jgi:hypothetical protein
MAIQVSSIAELQRIMMEQVHEAMKDSENDLIDEIKQSIDEVVYSYNPVRYDRSEDLKNTLELDDAQSKLGIGTASITINHNKKKANWFSVKDGSKYNYVPETVVNGKYGAFKGEGIFAHGSEYHDIDPKYGTSWSKPRDYMKHTQKKLENGGYLTRCLSPHLPPHITIK